mmetsp:Transcript_70515/g.216003  ORF Transcript_70515/g.216003 Transcript_70515/m.216003 type:complete len:296 (+) Transcript_70515:693-1580(+)
MRTVTNCLSKAAKSGKDKIRCGTVCSKFWHTVRSKSLQTEACPRRMATAWTWWSSQQKQTVTAWIVAVRYWDTPSMQSSPVMSPRVSVATLTDLPMFLGRLSDSTGWTPSSSMVLRFRPASCPGAGRPDEGPWVPPCSRTAASPEMTNSIESPCTPSSMMMSPGKYNLSSARCCTSSAKDAWFPAKSGHSFMAWSTARCLKGFRSAWPPSSALSGRSVAMMASTVSNSCGNNSRPFRKMLWTRTWVKQMLSAMTVAGGRFVARTSKPPKTVSACSVSSGMPSRSKRTAPVRSTYR